MSNSQLVDGKTGQLVSAAYSYVPTGANYTTGTNYTSTYVPVTASTYQYGTVPVTTGQPIYGSGNAQNLYYGGGSYQVSGGVQPGQTVVTGGQTVVTGGQVVGTTVNTGKEVIKGESRIEYVPFEKKVIEYKDEAKVERVPKKVKKVEYKEERKIETIPKEVTVTDYYAVEYLRQYIPQYVPEKIIEYVQVPKKQVRYEYIPVERQIVHYPDQPLEVERGAVGAQQSAQYVSGGQYVTGAQTYTTTTVVQPAEKVTYTSSTVPANTVYTTGGQYTYQTIPSGAVYTTSTPQYTYETVPANYVVNGSGSRVGQQYVENVSYGYPTGGNYEYTYSNAQTYQQK